MDSLIRRVERVCQILGRCAALIFLKLHVFYDTWRTSNNREMKRSAGLVISRPELRAGRLVGEIPHVGSVSSMLTYINFSCYKDIYFLLRNSPQKLLQDISYTFKKLESWRQLWELEFSQTWRRPSADDPIQMSPHKSC